MASLPLFKVEQWMDKYETTCSHNLAETCSDSISLQNLEDISRTAGIQQPIMADFATKRLTYGHICGSPELRKNIASLYPSMTGTWGQENVLITQGAIGANFLVLLSLIKAGDHVVCVHPTYQQLWEVPKGLGAEVDLCKLDPSQDWQYPLDQLISLLRPTTKLVIINNPNNPTGQLMDRGTLDALVAAVKANADPQCIILSDEVYRPLFHTLPEAEAGPPCSILETGYPHAIATGSLSKAWSLASIRVGWIATPRLDLVEVFASRRDYNVISVSLVDDAIAARALHPQVRKPILQRNMDLALTNRAILAKWIEATPNFTWVPTQAGTTALLRLSSRSANGTEVPDDESFCRQLHQEVGVLLAPGTCFDWPGWVRIGYVGNTKELQEGLEKITAFLETKLA